MKRIAAPMVGGLLTSAFLTLEVIPVVVTYWRQEDLLWQRLGTIDRRRLDGLRAAAWVIGGAAVLAGCALVSPIYLTLPGRTAPLALAIAGVAFLGGVAAYVIQRRSARHRVWPMA
jgi:Cu(I)/Ag(I) efflux system membrane protein CusA/SilA